MIIPTKQAQGASASASDPTVRAAKMHRAYQRKLRNAPKREAARAEAARLRKLAQDAQRAQAQHPPRYELLSIEQVLTRASMPSPAEVEAMLKEFEERTKE